MEASLFVSERYLKIPSTNHYRFSTSNHARSYHSNVPEIVKIGPFFSRNQLRQHSPPHPTLHQKVSLISQSVYYRLASFSTRFASTLQALSVGIVCFRLRCYLPARRRRYCQHWSLSIIETYLSSFFCLFKESF